MGLSNLTAMTIANRDDLLVTHSGSDCGRKYAGWICMPGGRPLLNTDQIFDSAKEAEQYMVDLKKELEETFSNIRL